MTSAAILLVISAPSGGGKTTVCQNLLATNANFRRAITCTTRSPRTGEKDGVDYYFLAPETFEQKVHENLFLEHANVYQFRYGTLKSEVLNHLRAGRDVLIALDVQGVATLQKRAQADPELRAALVTVFITPPSVEILDERLRKRGTDSEAVRQRRLSVAKEEIAQWPHFDYLVISSSIAEDQQRMQAIVDAEKLKTSRVKNFSV